LEKHPWLTYVLPMAVYMIVGALEPKPSDSGDATAWLPIPYRHYPIIYALKIGLTAAAVWFVLPGYRQFPFRVSPLAPAVGLVGVVVWVGLCSLEFEQNVLAPHGLESFVGLGARSAFDPFEHLAAYPAAYAWGFLAIRFVGLVAVVALIEEFFLRGFVMRFVMDARWWEIPFGQVSATAVVIGTLVPMLMHPAELLAAAVWFSMVTWLMTRTRNVWDCVVAHAVTNLLLGVYAVTNDKWHLI
jgi:CAAX prenyl protease-like protein